MTGNPAQYDCMPKEWPGTREAMPNAKDQGQAARLTETLKWGEPAYLTDETGSGSTIRLGRLKDSEHAAILFNCKTTLVDTFRERFPDQFEYRQKRALLLPVSGELPKQELTICLSLALTYHLDRRSRKAG